MASQTRIAGAGADLTGIGTVAWTSPGNITADDAAFAVSTVTAANPQTHYLKASTFGFTIPTGATINGITAEVERLTESGNAPRNRDNVVQLIKGGTIQGNDKADTTTDWTLTQTIKTYGSASDLWGLSFTDADINDSAFGLAFSAKTTTNSRNAQVDFIRLTVTYTANFGFPFVTAQRRRRHLINR